ncbi:unnamed protein product (macronuclear) [Paramecium tetraurelia]|uniref:PAS domain-containing protein n=1 Tax=Paramecium tetraurelia TaxID=5888 RepID=A0CMF3_PARTE|nr:uncharacterized protein GSPATT00008449001 [Paramecium tetraurelia]CAK71970.1 unnamed protein product [Paramecium tetraurelia]|eukprot:XP_001439367.1 hypothetical protein (macronuclear) [Paramecium tetraurelia strain d4-2]
MKQDLKNANFKHTHLEKQIRRLYIIFKEQVDLKKQQRLLDPKQSLQIYTFISSHLRECKLQRDRKAQKNIKLKYKCFCTDFFKDDDTFQSLEQMKQFAKELIGQTLEDEIIENQDIDLILIYIYFLVQIKKVPTQAIYEVIRLSMMQKEQTLKQQAIIRKLKHDALDKFSELVRKNDLVNQKFVFKKVYLYEESLNVLKSNLQTIVKQEKDFYACILTQVIDIDLIVNIGFKLLENIKVLEKQLQLLYKTNPQNNECDTIYNIFHKYIHYNKLRPKLYRRDGQMMLQFLQSSERIIYDPGSCVIQITLLQPRGNVIRYTRTFQKAIGYKDEEIQDQNINRFMPQIIANDHDLYLDNFVERGRINVVRNAVRVILGKTKSQFVVPINTRLRLEASTTEFGATALITPVNFTYGYMMLNEQGQIEELTKNLFDDVFEKYLGVELESVRGLDCLIFIPELAKIWESLFNEHFEKLDKRLECHLILPQLFRQNSKSLQSSRTTVVSKSLLQQNIIRSLENYPQDNVIYQISLHLTSLTTINLRLVILEMPEYKQIQNQKVTSRQLIQLRHRSSQLLNYSTQNDVYTQKADLLTSAKDILFNRDIDECDLEYENAIEEIKMVEDLRNQLAQINMINTAHNQNSSKRLLQSSDNFFEERVIELRQNINISEKSNDLSDSESEFKQRIQEQNLQYNSGSVGSRSSQNNTTALKRQMKDCLSDNRGLNVQTKLFLLSTYILVIVGYFVNYLILYFQFESINQDQNYEQLPFQFSYFYNEFVIAQSYINADDFQFGKLSEVTLEFFVDNIKDIDQTIARLPHINTINNLTMKSRMIIILSQLSKVQRMKEEILYSDFVNNTDQFNTQFEIIQSVQSINYSNDLGIYVLIEELVLIIFLTRYIYLCVKIIQMKTKIFKLFCTFSKEVIQEQFLQFSSLYNQLNNTKFKNHETDEEQFETTMMRQYQKTVTSNMLDKHNKVGKQISYKCTQYFNILKQKQILLRFSSFYLSLFMRLCVPFTSLATLSTVSARYNEKTQFEITNNYLALSYAEQAIILNQTIQQDGIDRQNKTVEVLKSLTTNLAQYQESSNTEIYDILSNSICQLLFKSYQYSYEEYSNLFSFEQCQSYSNLEKGLTFVVQELYSYQFEFLQLLQINNQSIYSYQEFLKNSQTQVQRVYAQYAFLVIIEMLKNKIKTLVTSTLVINSIMLGFASIIMSGALLITMKTIEKVKEQYKQSKQLLTLFPFDRLMENAYVVSFISQDLHFSV